jgi:plastocyanin
LTPRTSIAASWRGRLTMTVLAAALVAAPAAFAQSKDKDSSGGGEYTITLGNMDYGSPPASLKVGDTITFVNHDTVIHSVTARDHSFDLRINPGRSAKLTLMQAGHIQIYCLFHPNMRTTLNVAAK